MIIVGKVPKKHLKAINYFASKLFTPQLSRHIQIEVQYRKVDDYWGITIVDDYNKKGYPRLFIIEVKNDLSEKEKLMTIAHELVHIKQFAKLELNEEMTYWRGKYIKRGTPYLKQPWEIEAYDLGDRLFGEYYGNV